MSSYKFARKSSRSRSAGRMGFSKRARSMVVRGYTRSAGLYGRFNAPQRKPEQKAMDWHYANLAPTQGAQFASHPQNVPYQRPTVLNNNFLWNATTGTLPSAGAASSHLLCIEQGAGLNQRIGRKIQLKSLEIQGTVTLPGIWNMKAENYSASETHHMWIVIDTQVNGDNTTQAAQIWQGQPSSLGAAPNDCLSLRNIANSSRFRILKHIVTPLTRQAPVYNFTSPDILITAEPVSRQLNCFLKLDLPIEYANFVGDGSIESLRDNGLFVFSCMQTGLQMQTVASAVGADPALLGCGHETYNIRIRYTDV